MANQHGRPGGRRQKREEAGSGPHRSCPNCRHQGQLARAVKRARELALLPYSEGR